MPTYPAHALRTLALVTQGLHTPHGSQTATTAERILATVNQIGCVQIDTLQMVARSQYLVLWSRLGTYDPLAFDRLIYGPDRRLFEGWQHAACIIPLDEYRYQMPHQRSLREDPGNWYSRWLNQLQNPEVVAMVHERVLHEGARKVSDFASDGHSPGAWWNWRPAKVALEYLYAFGDLMIAGRVNFQRVYDLTERILPAWVDTSEPGGEERDRFWVERGARALGVGTPRHPGDYTWMKVGTSKPIVEALLKEGVLLPITGKLENGDTAELVVHRANLPLLEAAADGALKAERTTFLSPFDSLWWANRRDELLWGFHQSLEAYLPAPKRTYGYFCLPILHRDRLVGRFDPKLERKTGTLRLKAANLEPGVKPGDALVHDVAAAMRDFMAFHQAGELVIERSQPAAFGRKLLKAI
ncbi:MAG: YcaQ family DNA glycosylase [Anaerolineales bacterium]|nr:YcaQ family DNA glycosylase [Anaerolineales bacterium]